MADEIESKRKGKLSQAQKAKVQVFLRTSHKEQILKCKALPPDICVRRRCCATMYHLSRRWFGLLLLQITGVGDWFPRFDLFPPVTSPLFQSGRFPRQESRNGKPTKAKAPSTPSAYRLSWRSTWSEAPAPVPPSSTFCWKKRRLAAQGRCVTRFDCR